MEDPKQTLSLDTFKGKFLLIDFWATWCKPCVAELPGLQKAHATFKDRGLEVLSLSLDNTPEAVASLRSALKLPMPWKHALLEGHTEHPFCKALQVQAIPRVFLVSPDGKILAMDDELQGAALERTLARILAKR